MQVIEYYLNNVRFLFSIKDHFYFSLLQR